MMTTKCVPLRDVLYELSLSSPAPDAELLDEFVRRYPEYAASLTEFAITLALDAFGVTDDQPPELASTVTSPVVARAMSRFHNRLYAVKKISTAQVSAQTPNAENPFNSLQRSELRDLAQSLNANSVFVMKLRDREILLGTMSLGFRRQVAEGLKTPIEVVTAHFAALPEIHPRAHFKADQKPRASMQQTFEEAVRNSGLTPEQQKYLLSL